MQLLAPEASTKKRKLLVLVLCLTVSILFMTPTTEYAVAVTRLWHQKPAHDIRMPFMSNGEESYTSNSAQKRARRTNCT